MIVSVTKFRMKNKFHIKFKEETNNLSKTLIFILVECSQKNKIFWLSVFNVYHLFQEKK